MSPFVELHLDRRVLDDRREVVAPRLERREVDGGLDQRADRAARVERAVEALEVRPPAADERADLAGVRARDDHGAVELDGPFAESRDAVRERALGRGLHRRVERREHDEARALEVVPRIVRRELAAHEPEERRLRRAAPRARKQIELLLFRGGGVLGGYEARVRHFLQHEVAALERAVRVPAWIVVRRPAHDRDEQRELVQIELGERLAEVELAREPEAVHRACAVLAEIDLVDVRGHEVGFVVAQLERDRHERLAQLARPAALVAQEVAAHELLRERARALSDLARREIHERSAQHSEHVDAVVLVEAPVLDRLQGRRQERRNVGRRDDQPVLAVRREQAADQERIEARYRPTRRRARRAARRFADS